MESCLVACLEGHSVKGILAYDLVILWCYIRGTNTYRVHAPMKMQVVNTMYLEVGDTYVISAPICTPCER